MKSFASQSAASSRSANIMRRMKNTPTTTFSIQKRTSSANTSQSQKRTPTSGRTFAATRTQAESGFSAWASLATVELLPDQSDVGEGKPVDDVAHQCARKLELRAEAHLL